MRRFLLALFFAAFLSPASAQMSYWWQQLTRKPDAKQSQEFWFVPGANVSFTYETNHVIISAATGGGPWDPAGTAQAATNGLNAALYPLITQALLTNRVHWTNVVALTNSQFQTVDLEIKEGDFQTNAAFAFLGVIHKSTTNYQSAVVTVYNTSGAAAAITAPPNTHTNGALPYLVTNITKVLFEWHPLYQYTNMLCYPLW